MVSTLPKRKLTTRIIDSGIFEKIANRAECYFFGSTLMYLLSGDSKMYTMYYERFRDGKRHSKDGMAFG